LEAADGDNPGTLQNGAAIISNSASGSAVSFSTAGQSAVVAHHADLISNSGFTLSAWINPSTVVTDRTQYIVNKGISDADFDYGFITTFSSTAPPANIDANGKLVFRVGDLTPNRVIGPILPVNTWTLVTGVFDVARGELRLYINGTLSAVEKVTGSITMGAGDLSFSSPANWYHGKLDEERFYNRALTDQEVTVLFGAFGTPTPLPSNTPTATSVSTLTPTATPLPLSAQQWGTGADGNISISAGETYNIGTLPSKITNRTCPDAVSYSVTSLTGTRAYLSSSPAANCLQAGDEVMLINLQGTLSSIYNTGAYEFLRIASISEISNYVQFTTAKLHWYGESYRNDDGIGTGATQQKVMLIRVPNYNNVTVNGVLTGSPWSGLTGGLAVFRVSGTLEGSGLIHMNAGGYRGGQSPQGTAFQGESYAGPGLSARNPYPNLGGGGAGWESRGNGGGAGHATNGTTSTDLNGGYGGLSYGQSTLTKLLPGSGGGGAEYWNGHEWSATGNDGGDGGNGGGIVFVAAYQIAFSGTVSAAGANGDPGREGIYDMQGGAGSGGSVRIEGNTISLSAVSAPGGNAYAPAGPGRIAVYYQNSNSIASSNPAPYLATLGGSQNTATPSPTVDPFSQFGTGQDGDLSIAAYTPFNIHTQSQNLSRTCTTGGDSVSYTVTSLTNLSATLGSYPASHCLVAGDEVLLINLHGSSTSAVNTGKYEFLRVGAVVGNTIYFLTPKVNFYGNNASDDTGLGTDQTVSMYRVPNYRNVTVNGTLTAAHGTGQRTA
jgi:hypothetical protein